MHGRELDHPGAELPDGSLAQPSRVRPLAHVWCLERAEWHRDHRARRRRRAHRRDRRRVVGDRVVSRPWRRRGWSVGRLRSRRLASHTSATAVALRTHHDHRLARFTRALVVLRRQGRRCVCGRPPSACAAPHGRRRQARGTRPVVEGTLEVVRFHGTRVLRELGAPSASAEEEQRDAAGCEGGDEGGDAGDGDDRRERDAADAIADVQGTGRLVIATRCLLTLLAAEDGVGRRARWVLWDRQYCWHGRQRRWLQRRWPWSRRQRRRPRRRQWLARAATADATCFRWLDVEPSVLCASTCGVHGKKVARGHLTVR